MEALPEFGYRIRGQLKPERLILGSFEHTSPKKAPGPKLRLMDKILHGPKDPKLWELWYIPYYGSCRILSFNRMT